MANKREIQMITKHGFLNLFWDDYKAALKKDPVITHQKVYENLENEYINFTGQRRYANYQSFKTVQYRK